MHLSMGRFSIELQHGGRAHTLISTTVMIFVPISPGGLARLLLCLEQKDRAVT